MLIKLFLDFWNIRPKKNPPERRRTRFWKKPYVVV